MDCRVCVASAGDLWVGKVGGGGIGQSGGGFSHESEYDLAVMVGDFLENGSFGAESGCSSDSDSGLSELAVLADKIPKERPRDSITYAIISVPNDLVYRLRLLKMIRNTPPENSTLLKIIPAIATFTNKVPTASEFVISISTLSSRKSTLVTCCSFRCNKFCKRPVAQYENDLLSVVYSHILSITEKDLKFIKSGVCYASCIRFHLVKVLRDSGYDAGVCSSKWQGSGKVPGGDHEYIDVVNYTGSCGSDRLIIDTDFKSHFEIARAVDSYNKILDSLPVVYVGSYTRLKQFLVIMVEAAKSSLKQNSMPLPPWRSLAYLQAKWQSPFQRQLHQENNPTCVANSTDLKLCTERLRKLKSSVQSEIETERLLMSRNSEHGWRLKPDRWRHPVFRPL